MEDEAARLARLEVLQTQQCMIQDEMQRLQGGVSWQQTAPQYESGGSGQMMDGQNFGMGGQQGPMMMGGGSGTGGVMGGGGGQGWGGDGQSSVMQNWGSGPETPMVGNGMGGRMGSGPGPQGWAPPQGPRVEGGVVIARPIRGDIRAAAAGQGASARPMGPGQGPPKPCRYWAKNGSCREGAECNFEHPGFSGGGPFTAAPHEKFCEFFAARGFCKKGNLCDFAHSGVQKPARKTCEFFEKNGKCKYGDECLWVHNQNWLEARQAIDCNFWRRGDCRRGAACTFRHAPEKRGTAAAAAAAEGAGGGGVEEAKEAGAPAPGDGAGEGKAGTGTEEALPEVKKEGTEAGKDEGNEDQNKETPSKEGESKPLCKFFSTTGKCKKGEICEFLHDASKPKVICRFFSDTGKCKKGGTCEYAHERPGPKAEGGARAAAAAPAPAPGGSDDRPVCKFFLDGRCRSGLDCRFRHVDLLTYKTRDCKFFRRGTCGDGDGCHYAHSVEERRTPSAAALAAAATMMCQGVLGKRPLPGGFEQGGGPLFHGGGVMMQGPSSFQYGYQNYGSGGVGSDGWQGGSFGRENDDVSFDGNKRARSSSTWGPCRNGKACRMHQQGICKFDHSSGKATNPCRYGRKCRLNRTGECTFQHF